jgi:hypothetical protein
MTDYKATPKQWADIEKWNSTFGGFYGCVLELRARVKALEVGLKDEADCNRTCMFNLVDRIKALEAGEKQRQQHEDAERAMEAYRMASAEVSGGSMVERVQHVIYNEYARSKTVGCPEARAAIREVALWLNEVPLDLYPGDRGIVVNALYNQANQ